MTQEQSRASKASLYQLPTIMKFALASSVLVLASCASAFAPATSGSSFVQSRVAFAPASSSTALQMNLFDRFTRVAKSNINNILKNLEDPEKIMNQAVEDMQVCHDGTSESPFHAFTRQDILTLVPLHYSLV